jgi:hypothetical protein
MRLLLLTLLHSRTSVNKHAINQPLLACRRIEVKAALSKSPRPDDAHPCGRMRAAGYHDLHPRDASAEPRGEVTENDNCVHVAAMVADPHPLELPLRCHWVQEYVDEELVLSGQTASQGCKNPVLTVTISFGNVAQVILLLSEFPRAIDAEPDSSQPVAANVDQASAKGSPPLYMAVFKKNAKLVQVLLAANADSTAVSAKNDSCIDLAHRLKREQDAAIEKRKERALQDNKPFVQPPEGDIDRIVKLLDGTPNLKRKPHPEPVPNVELPPDEADEIRRTKRPPSPKPQTAAKASRSCSMAF